MRATTGDDLVIVPTGTANVASVRAAFHRLGVEPRDAATPDDVEAAARVVLPGVGAFGSAMGAIDAAGMRAVLRDRVDAGRATLAVCVGMQLLGESSTESPGVAGLGVLPAVVSGFPAGVRVPQLGWNQVEPAAGSRYLSPGWAYFANSFRFSRLRVGLALALPPTTPGRSWRPWSGDPSWQSSSTRSCQGVGGPASSAGGWRRHDSETQPEVGARRLGLGSPTAPR